MKLFGKSEVQVAQESAHWDRSFAEIYPALSRLGVTANTDLFAICERLALELERKAEQG